MFLGNLYSRCLNINFAFTIFFYIHLIVTLKIYNETNKIINIKYKLILSLKNEFIVNKLNYKQIF